MGMPIREVYLFRNFVNSKLWKCNGPILMLADLEECKWHDQNTEWHTFADFADGLKCIYVWHTVRNVELLWVKYVKKCNEAIRITWCRLTNWNAMAPPGWPILMPEKCLWNIPNWITSHQKSYVDMIWVKNQHEHEWPVCWMTCSRGFADDLKCIHVRLPSWVSSCLPCSLSNTELYLKFQTLWKIQTDQNTKSAW